MDCYVYQPLREYVGTADLVRLNPGERIVTLVQNTRAFTYVERRVPFRSRIATR